MKFSAKRWVPAASVLAVLCLNSLTFAAEGSQRATTARKAKPAAESTTEEQASTADVPRRTTAARKVSQTRPARAESGDSLPITSSLRMPRSTGLPTHEPIGVGFNPALENPRGFVPRHEQGAPAQHVRTRTLAPDETVVEEESVMEADQYLSGYADDGDCHGGGCGGCGGCDRCCMIPCPMICWENFSLFGGVQGFTGPPNRGETGSFGFNEGVNYGAAFPCLPGGQLGWQLGARATQSNLSGSAITQEERNQLFVTAGLFRRVDWGFQMGVAVDFLRESWYYDASLMQLRGELSWMFPCQHEFGFWFTADTHSDQVQSRFRDPRTGVTATVTENWRPTDLYAFYYRRRFGEGDFGTARLFAGFSGESDGLIGGDFLIPFTDSWSLSTGFTYLVPQQATGFDINSGHAQESWNIGLGLVWTPGRSLCSKSYYRPLLDVADNGNFLVDRN